MRAGTLSTESNRMERVHILLGSSEDDRSFDRAVESRDSLPWIVPKASQPGDLALMLFGAAIRGTGRIENAPEPAERPGTYNSMVGSLTRLNTPLPVPMLVEKFAGRWKWPTYPRGYTTVPEIIVEELLRLIGRLPPVQRSMGDEILAPFDPKDESDGRKRIMRAITERQGQGSFRADVLAAYGGRCAISRCQCVDVLDAAHISPYNGVRTNDVRNGLLLRTDLHALFDRHRLAINPENMTVVVDPSIEDRTYRIFDGKTLTLPEHVNQQPSKDALRRHFRRSSFPSTRST